MGSPDQCIPQRKVVGTCFVGSNLAHLFVALIASSGPFEAEVGRAVTMANPVTSLAPHPLNKLQMEGRTTELFIGPKLSVRLLLQERQVKMLQ